MWPKRRRISPWVWLWVAVGLMVLAYPAYKYHQAFSRTGFALREGRRIYGELQALEPKVLSGRIADPNAPEFKAIEEEIKAGEHERDFESFQDAVIFSSLEQYESGLQSIALSNSMPGQEHSADRALEVDQLKRERAAVEKSLE